jgi:hypothetical protein
MTEKTTITFKPKQVVKRLLSVSETDHKMSSRLDLVWETTQNE